MLNIKSISVQSAENNTANVTFYSVITSFADSNKYLVVRRRYKEFEHLHAELKKANKKLTVAMPSKTALYRHDTKVIEARRENFHKMLQELCKLDSVVGSSIFRQFIGFEVVNQNPTFEEKPELVDNITAHEQDLTKQELIITSGTVIEPLVMSEKMEFPFGAHLGEATMKKQWPLQKQVGKILFSKTRQSESELQNCDDTVLQFTLGEPIFARAVWARPLRNYPIGHCNGKPVYPPKFIFKERTLQTHYLQFALQVWIDNVQLVGKGPDNEPIKSWCSKKFFGADLSLYERAMYDDTLGKCVDYYAFHQSMELMLLGQDKQLLEGWDYTEDAFWKVLSTLPLGKHHVKVQLSYRIVQTYENKKFKSMAQHPYFDTMLSDPLAVGEFDIQITSENQMKDLILLQRGIGHGMLDEEAILFETAVPQFLMTNVDYGAKQDKSELPVHTLIHGPWNKDKDMYFIPMKVVFYRGVNAGWSEEACVMSDLLIYTKDGPVNVANPQIHSVKLVSSEHVNINALPDAIWVNSTVKPLSKGEQSLIKLVSTSSKLASALAK